MSLDTEGRLVTVDELLEEAKKIVAERPDDVLAWLMGERHLETARRKEAAEANDTVTFNRHDARCGRLGEAIAETLLNRRMLADTRRVLTARLIVALKEAEQPAWRPTHRHYKGALYRVLRARVMDAMPEEELIEGVIYDDARGNTYFLHRDRWESLLESGKPRYAALMPGEDR